MIEMTQTARERFDAYLLRLRRAFLGSPQVEADEVEQNVREHIEIALAAAPAPVGADRLGAVLDRLGAPERWVADEHRPAWRRAMDRFRSGPEDWRLAYIAFTLFLLMFLLAPVGGMLLLVPAYVVSRAVVSLLDENGDAIGAKKWLIYPAIVMLAVVVGVAILMAPPAAAVAFSLQEGGLYRATGLTRPELLVAQRVQLETGLIMAASGIWWVIASLILLAIHRPLQIAFRPVLDRWRRGHLAVLATSGAILAAIGAVTMSLVM